MGKDARMAMLEVLTEESESDLLFTLRGVLLFSDDLSEWDFVNDPVHKRHVYTNEDGYRFTYDPTREVWTDGDMEFPKEWPFVDALLEV